MRIFFACLLLLILPFSDSEGLDGCKSPEEFSKFLLDVKDLNWSTITVKELVAKWPELVINHDCGSEDCSFVLDIQRLIDPNCECCVVFVFKKEEQKEVLKGMNFYYSSETREGALKFLKQLIPATGVEADYNPENAVNHRKRNEETWQKEISGMLVTVGMEIYPNKGIWQVELGYSQKVKTASTP